VRAAFDPFAVGWASEDRDEDRFRPLAPPPVNPLANDAFLACTRGYESVYAGGYRAVSPGGRYRGAYQFDEATWNGTARHLRRFDLVGVLPDRAAPAVQDLLAYTLYKWQGASHWHGRCAGLT
jgi:Transglycosylase-like domain